eukprot:10326323-Lingulodinium_polyedra.AAC.1
MERRFRHRGGGGRGLARGRWCRLAVVPPSAAEQGSLFRNCLAEPCGHGGRHGPRGASRDVIRCFARNRFENWCVRQEQRAWNEGCTFRGRGDAAVDQRWTRDYF